MSDSQLYDVINTINLYAFVVDSQQWDLFDQVFTDDVTADFGGGAVWQDLEAFKRDFIAIHTPFDSTQHITTNHVVRINGDEASAVTYVYGRFLRDVEGGNLFESTGWYDDKLVRTDAGWRIKERVCRSVWSGGNPRVMETIPGMTGEGPTHALKTEAAGGEVAFLAALRR
jgi:hypothetical protein